MDIERSERPIAGGAGPLAGRPPLVTRGSRGIGAAIVRRLAADGAAVALTYTSSAERAEKLAAEGRPRIHRRSHSGR